MEITEHNEIASIAQDSPEDETCQVFVVNRDLVEKLKREPSNAPASAALFKTLGDESRCIILTALSKCRELCVCDLSVLTDLSMPTVSHHLRKLREQGFVGSRREGKLVFYQLIDEDVRVLLRVAATRGLVATSQPRF